MRVIVLIFFCSFLIVNQLCSQNEDKKIYGITKFKSIEPIEVLDYFIIHKAAAIKLKIDGNIEDKQKKFYVDIPKGMYSRAFGINYKGYYYKFTDDENAFLIIEANKTLKPDSIYTCNCKGFSEDVAKYYKINLYNTKYCGYKSYNRYKVYYFNIDADKVTLFLKAIGSIRNKK